MHLLAALLPALVALTLPSLLHGAPRPYPDGRFPLVANPPLGADGQIDTVVFGAATSRLSCMQTGP